MKRYFSFLFCTTLIWTAVAANASERSVSDAVGYVKNVTGEVTVLSGGEQLMVIPGSAVHAGDTIKTGPSSSVGITFRDESRTSLGPNSEMRVKSFTFEPVNNNYSFVTSMVKGTLYYVSGLIAKLSPGSASVETPEATIGIRGTRFLLRVEDDS